MSDKKMTGSRQSYLLLGKHPNEIKLYFFQGYFCLD